MESRQEERGRAIGAPAIDADQPAAEPQGGDATPQAGLAGARFVVFATTLDYAVRRGIVAVLDALPRSAVLVVLHAPRTSLGRLVRNQWRHLKRNGWRWIPYEIGDVAGRVRDRLRQPARVVAWRPGGRFDRDQMASDPRVEFLRVEDIHAASTLRRVRDFAPDLGLALAAPILKPGLFSLPRLGTINLHKARVPEYRGMPPAFWELYRGETEVGCTVHIVDAGLDTGPVVRQVTVPVRPHSTVKGLRLTLDEIGVGLVRDAALDLLRGHATVEPQRPGGTTFRKPTLAQQREFARRARSQRPAGLREAAKDAAFCGYVHVVRPLPRWALARRRAQRVVVLLYHRVRDDLRDSLTVGIEQFDAQMRWVARRYPVVDITDVVAGRVPRDTRRPAVAVTFDDGYLDNYEHAFPILLRHRIPAAFFVPTGRIGTDGALEHDLRRLGRGLPSMSWDHLREMLAAGFTVGSHTVTHLDCGRADLGQVRAELRESRDVLAERLGVLRPVFAYPYGGRENMTPQALEVVREEGYAGCLSAYGGVNDGRFDPFDVRRAAIDHRFSAWAFEARLEGWR